MSAWQPIETAPKDGTFIMVASREDSDENCQGPFVVYWFEWDQPHPDTGDAERMCGWAIPDGMVKPPSVFTHWMPLPEPPK